MSQKEWNGCRGSTFTVEPDDSSFDFPPRSRWPREGIFLVKHRGGMRSVLAAKFDAFTVTGQNNGSMDGSFQERRIRRTDGIPFFHGYVTGESRRQGERNWDAIIINQFRINCFLRVGLKWDVVSWLLASSAPQPAEVSYRKINYAAPPFAAGIRVTALLRIRKKGSLPGRGKIYMKARNCSSSVTFIPESSIHKVPQNSRETICKA